MLYLWFMWCLVSNHLVFESIWNLTCFEEPKMDFITCHAHLMLLNQFNIVFVFFFCSFEVRYFFFSFFFLHDWHILILFELLNYSWQTTDLFVTWHHLHHRQQCFWSDKATWDHLPSVQCPGFLEVLLFPEISGVCGCVKRFYRKMSHSSEWEEIWNWRAYVRWRTLSLNTQWFVLLGANMLWVLLPASVKRLWSFFLKPH